MHFILILFGFYFNSQPHKEADILFLFRLSVDNYFNSQPHKEADRGIAFTSYADGFISTHSLTRRLTAILFNKNRFVQFIFITLYQSPPQPLLLPPFFHPIFSFSARISGANRPRIGWGLGVRTIGSGYR